LLYDRDFPEVVYDVVDNRDLFKKGWSAVAYRKSLRKIALKKFWLLIETPFRD